MSHRMFAWVPVFVGLAALGGVRGAEPDGKWEDRAIAVLESGDAKALRALAAEFWQVKPEDRQKLPVRIREDSVEFSFRGEFPGDKEPWVMLEYLVSGAGKDYETLLVVADAELKRTEPLRKVFAKRPVKGRGKTWSARLVWTDGETPQSVDLTDLLQKLKPAERDYFLDHLAYNGTGIGNGANVVADSAGLPRRRVPALLQFTFRVVEKK
jgi:hypothetical protein